MIVFIVGILTRNYNIGNDNCISNHNNNNSDTSKQRKYKHKKYRQ